MVKHKRKGTDFERQCVNKLKDIGVNARRVPLSGAGHEKGDVIFEKVKGVFTAIECKWRKSGFKQIYDWIGPFEYLIIKADRKEPLWVVRESEMLRMLRRLNNGEN